jgi:roadblock/LC7 domain-containing protein
MSEPDILPPVPELADSKPRAITAAKEPVTNPEAPYGWMKDPKTGETRPRKRPGRQAKADAPPPPGRASNASRERQAPPSGKKSVDYRKPLMDTVEGFWMILAAIPSSDKPVKVAGIDVHSLTIRAKAQAAVLEENAAQLVNAANMVAQHNDSFAKGVEKWTSSTGSAWIMPAMMAVLPFAVASAQVWRVPVEGDLTLLAKQTEAKFDELFKNMKGSGMPAEEPLADDPAAS